ncbi:hypothetical protein [Phaffia rhodozyma]|uniref:Uncharacterized protein n=1 Tax=Phaffia rhodozyma TaxID=264483 RepID=A0A0F7SP29_PHARH|nr:hypothetical protein [Phaffia rhodozyma]
MRLPTIHPKYPRAFIGGVLFATYYGLSTWQIYRKDQIDALLEFQDRQHQAYLMSDQGKADQLAVNQAEEEERRQMKAWEDEENKKLAQTPEGRAILEKNRNILISDLRYRETKLQYLLARQEPDLKKAQVAVREKLYNEAEVSDIKELIHV